MDSRFNTDECGTNECTTSSHSKINTPKYVYYDSRVKSFKQWPKVFGLYQIYNLSESGFFYTGVTDKIECFWCGLKLHHWNDCAIPHEQHSIWSPNCTFLKMTKGEEYILQTREQFVVKEEDKLLI